MGEACNRTTGYQRSTDVKILNVDIRPVVLHLFPSLPVPVDVVNGNSWFVYKKDLVKGGI